MSKFRGTARGCFYRYEESNYADAGAATSSAAIATSSPWIPKRSHGRRCRIQRRRASYRSPPPADVVLAKSLSASACRGIFTYSVISGYLKSSASRFRLTDCCQTGNRSRVSKCYESGRRDEDAVERSSDKRASREAGAISLSVFLVL